MCFIWKKKSSRFYSLRSTPGQQLLIVWQDLDKNIKIRENIYFWLFDNNSRGRECDCDEIMFNSRKI